VTRLVIVSNVRLYRDGVAIAFADDARIEVLRTAPHGAEAVGTLRQCQPDVALLDLTGAEGLSEVRLLAEAAPAVRLVVLAVPTLEREIVTWVNAGIAGYVTRDSSLADVVAAVEYAAQGDFLCSPSAAGQLLRRVAALGAEQRRASPLAPLTSRERDVFQLIAQGLSNKQIAHQLCIELSTVKNHVHSILEKVSATNRVDAVAKLGSAGLPLHDGAGPRLELRI
jgi:two-component system nitrate/nitrite response regulator NarL